MENIDIQVLVEKNKELENEIVNLKAEIDLLITTLNKTEKKLVTAEKDRNRWEKDYHKASGRHQWCY